MPIAKPAQDALDDFGIEAVCDLLSEGAGFRGIARCVGVGVGSVLLWLDRNPGHSARALGARKVTAVLWDEQAEQVLREAPSDREEIMRAKELAQHFRWRASKINPREYGDKLDVNHGGMVGVVGIPYDPDSLDPDEREVLQRVLLKQPTTIEHEDE
jgi:hypothetical protein